MADVNPFLGLDPCMPISNGSSDSMLSTLSPLNQTLMTPMLELGFLSLLVPSCSDAFQTSPSVQVLFVETICLFGIVGNALTLVILSRRRLRAAAPVDEDPSVRSAHVDMQALAASNLLLCLFLLPHGFLPTNCVIHQRRWSFHVVYWLYGGSAINALMLTGTWLTVTMAVVRYLAIAFPFRVRLLIGSTGSKVKVAVVFAASCLLNVPRLFEHRIETIRCSITSPAVSHVHARDNVTAADRMVPDNGEMEIYMQMAGPLQSLGDQNLMNVYVWVYFVVGIFVPLVLLAISNFGLVRTLRQSTRLRRRFHVRPAHVDANERVTTVLAAVVVAYLVLVAPAEILLFIDRQLEIASKPVLATAVQVTNILQMVSVRNDDEWVVYSASNLTQCVDRV